MILNKVTTLIIRSRILNSQFSLRAGKIMGAFPILTIPQLIAWGMILVSGIVIGLLGLNLYFLLYVWWREKGSRPRLASPAILPHVTIHIPTYNERRVVERILNACLQLDYPRDKLDIIVVDDSTDSTAAILQEYQARFPDQIRIIHRTKRTGFKAGALQEALKCTTGDFIAIFDADHVPRKDFLLKALPHFSSKKIAFVQGLWYNHNSTRSAVARSSGLAVESHFRIEYFARLKAESFPLVFGSAGIIRKSALASVGGWHSDTLTEDVDLTIRLYLAGWRGAYSNKAQSAIEMPNTLAVFKRQQHRWAQGHIQCLVKYGSRIITSPNMTARQKLGCLMFLSYYLIPGLFLITGFIGVTLLSFVFTPESLIAFLFTPHVITLGSFFFLAIASGAAMYALIALRKGWSWLPAVLYVAAIDYFGICFEVLRATLEALFGFSGVFERTARTQVNKSRSIGWRLTHTLRTRFLELGSSLLAFTASFHSFSLSSFPLMLFSAFLSCFGVIWLYVALTP